MKSRYIFSLNIPSIYLLRTKSKKSAVSISLATLDEILLEAA